MACICKELCLCLCGSLCFFLLGLNYLKQRKIVAVFLLRENKELLVSFYKTYQSRMSRINTDRNYDKLYVVGHIFDKRLVFKGFEKADNGKRKPQTHIDDNKLFVTEHSGYNQRSYVNHKRCGYCSRIVYIQYAKHG